MRPITTELRRRRGTPLRLMLSAGLSLAALGSASAALLWRLPR